MPVSKAKPRKPTSQSRNKKTPQKKSDKSRKAPKKTVKKKKKIDTKKSDKKEFKKAVAKLPGLIIEQAKLEKKVSTPIPETEKSTDVIEIRELKPSGETTTRVGQNYDDGHDKKWLMWLGVIIFTVFIFIIWGWNLMVQFQDSTKTNDLAIIKNIKKDATEILDDSSEKINIITTTTTEENIPPVDDTPAEDEEINLKEKIKQNIANIITTFESSTSTTSTNTVTNTTTETNFNTTTNPNNDIITSSL